MTALVRTVVVNYNGGELLLRCLESLTQVDWPPGRLETVVVDNASSDGSADAARSRHPDVRIIRAPHNLGFAGGNNLALRDLGASDYVALLNSDAVVERDWLSPLVEELERDARLGAASPKILFAPRFAELGLEAPGFVRGGWDPRPLGIRLSGVRVGGESRWEDSHFVSGWYDLEHERTGAFRWSAPRAELRVPWGASDQPSVQLRLGADREQALIVRTREREVTITVRPAERWVDVPVDAAAVDVVNNVGTLLVRGGYGADRGFLEVDSGQYDTPAEVFAWSGCSVLLRRAYLEDAGLFDARLFLYYEDFDLAWRGRALGWRHAYVPGSVVRHFHAASTVAGSALFDYYVERNRLLVHVKNAPADYAAETIREALALTGRHARRDVARPLLYRRRPRPTATLRRLRALGGFAALLPAALADRQRLRRRQRVPDTELMSWAVGT